jgi:glycosyltransferase involved in cell wall biosynthesis
LNKKLKIFHLISSLSRGGRERQLATIVSNTDFVKYPTKIVFFNETEHTYVDEYELKKHSIKIESKSFWKRLLELHQTIKQEQPDIIYTWANLESLFILLLNPFHRFKFINGSVRHGIRSKRFSHYFRSFILHLSPHIVANSNAGIKVNNLKRGKILHNGIDQKFINRIKPKEKEEKRKAKLNLEPDTTILISVANLVPYKDYFSILKALKLLKEKNYSFYYFILGEGLLRTKIKETIDNYRLKQHIHLAGNVENVNDYLQMADIFIHSSKGEGCSNAILEAMAAGLPVVASNTGGTSEIVTKENGLLFEYKKAEQLEENLLLLLNDKQKMTDLGENSYRIVKEKFTIPRMMNNYYKIVDTIAKK